METIAYDLLREHAVRGVRNLIIGQRYVKCHVPSGELRSWQEVPETAPDADIVWYAETAGPFRYEPKFYLGWEFRIHPSFPADTDRNVMLAWSETRKRWGRTAPETTIRYTYPTDDGVEKYDDSFYNDTNFLLHVEGLAALGIVIGEGVAHNYQETPESIEDRKWQTRMEDNAYLDAPWG